MRSSKLVAALAVVGCFALLQPVHAGPPEHMQEPSSPPSYSPPPSPPSAPEPAPAPSAPSAPEPSPSPSPAPEPSPSPEPTPAPIENPRPTDPGTEGRRISQPPPPPPAERGTPTDPGTVGRRIPVNPGNPGYPGYPGDPGNPGTFDDGGDEPTLPDVDDSLAPDGGGMASPAAKPPAAESFDVRIVNVEVAVADLAGRPVLGLARGDFEVLEDGRPIPIADFHAPAAVRDLATFYSLGFSPSPAGGGGDHAIAVRVRRQAPPDKPAPQGAPGRSTPGS
jgi:hypothetical protein